MIHVNPTKINKEVHPFNQRRTTCIFIARSVSESVCLKDWGGFLLFCDLRAAMKDLIKIKALTKMMAKAGPAKVQILIG